jgi:hypothetical protein
MSPYNSLLQHLAPCNTLGQHLAPSSTAGPVTTASVWDPDPRPTPHVLLQSHGMTPLTAAAGCGHNEVVRQLLGAGAAVNGADQVGLPLLGRGHLHSWDTGAGCR